MTPERIRELAKRIDDYLLRERAYAVTCAWESDIVRIITDFLQPPPGSKRVRIAVAMSAKQISCSSHCESVPASIEEAREWNVGNEITHEGFVEFDLPAVREAMTIEGEVT